MSHPNDLGAAVAVERDRVIHRLSNHFAVDLISIDELDRRIELAYRASTVEELRALVADLGSAAPPVAAPVYVAPQTLAPHQDQGRLLSVMSSLKRTGPWLVPRNLALGAIMSDTKLDLREAHLSPGVTDIDIFAFWAAVRITVPPGVRVVDETTSIMADSRNESLADELAGSSPCIVRVRGSVVMSELVVQVKPVGAKLR